VGRVLFRMSSGQSGVKESRILPSRPGPKPHNGKNSIEIAVLRLVNPIAGEDLIRTISGSILTGNTFSGGTFKTPIVRPSADRLQPFWPTTSF
jgi:hypothetical protein